MMTKIFVLYGFMVASALFSGEEQSKKLKAWVQTIDKITILNTYGSAKITLPITDTTTLQDVQKKLWHKGFYVKTIPRDGTFKKNFVPITFVKRPAWYRCCCPGANEQHIIIRSSTEPMKSIMNRWDTREIEIHCRKET